MGSVTTQGIKAIELYNERDPNLNHYSILGLSTTPSQGFTCPSPDGFFPIVPGMNPYPVTCHYKPLRLIVHIGNCRNNRGMQQWVLHLRRWSTLPRGNNKLSFFKRLFSSFSKLFIELPAWKCLWSCNGGLFFLLQRLATSAVYFLTWRLLAPLEVVAVRDASHRWITWSYVPLDLLDCRNVVQTIQCIATHRIP